MTRCSFCSGIPTDALMRRRGAVDLEEPLIAHPQCCPPGRIVTQGGDIDNRPKTLLEALKVPNLPNALPQGAVPAAGESPFFCLLEDDNLITGLNVETDRLLDPSAGPNEVVILIHALTRLTVGTVGNLGLV